MRLAEMANGFVLEQNRLDVFVGKIARCGYFLDALAHRDLKLTTSRHYFAVGLTRRAGGEKRDVVGDRPSTGIKYFLLILFLFALLICAVSKMIGLDV